MKYGVGIDVSKGKSTVAILSINGEVIEMPFDINHDVEDLEKLDKKLQEFSKEDLKVVLEQTGTYHLPILTGTVYTISDYFSILTFGNLAKSLPGHNIVPVIEVFRLGNPEHGEKFLHIRTDLWEKIFLFCKEFRIISQLSPIFPKGTVKDLRLHHVLEHMASVAQFRHIAGPAVRDLTDPGDSRNIRKGYRNPQLRRGCSYPCPSVISLFTFGTLTKRPS